MTAPLLDPRRHGAPPPRPATPPPATPPPARRTLAGGGVVQTNAGGGVLVFPGATAAQLHELRTHLDAALAVAEGGAERAR